VVAVDEQEEERPPDGGLLTPPDLEFPVPDRGTPVIPQ
jgi:hypothetical protein